MQKLNYICIKKSIGKYSDIDAREHLKFRFCLYRKYRSRKFQSRNRLAGQLIIIIKTSINED